MVTNNSVLLITLDSCRYDTLESATAPNIKNIGPLHKAEAPGYFTYSSHQAIFMGFTPGIAKQAEPFLNPKYSKIFKLTNVSHPGKGYEFITLSGKNIIDGFKKEGFAAYGTAAMGWFDVNTETGKVLTEEFDDFYYTGTGHGLEDQVNWIFQKIHKTDKPVFVFLNIGETHVPYYYQGAEWDPHYNPCVPFSDTNDADVCRYRQLKCVEWVDSILTRLLDAFSGSTTIICADHGDCWGEDGLWEHGFYHPKVIEVPLIFKL
jgi:hypothetical protein